MKFFSFRDILWKSDVFDKAQSPQQRDCPPAWVELARFQTEACGFRKGVVIVVPGFPHCDQAQVVNTHETMAASQAKCHHPPTTAVVAIVVNHNDLTGDQTGLPTLGFVCLQGLCIR